MLTGKTEKYSVYDNDGLNGMTMMQKYVRFSLLTSCLHFLSGTSAG
jgi:hypothetical protein